MKKRKDSDKVYARLRAAATADRIRRMIYEGVAFADEIDDIAAAVQAFVNRCKQTTSTDRPAPKDGSYESYRYDGPVEPQAM